MKALDADIISLDIPRSQEDSKRSMEFKDAMREACLNEVRPSAAASNSGRIETLPFRRIRSISQAGVRRIFPPLLDALLDAQHHVEQRRTSQSAGG